MPSRLMPRVPARMPTVPGLLIAALGGAGIFVLAALLAGPLIDVHPGRARVPTRADARSPELGMEGGAP